MAPKTKSRGKSQFDSNKFVSSKAQDHYSDAFQSRKLIQEHCFKSPGGEVENLIVRRQWDQFCCFSVVAVISIVREFYANLPEAEDGQVMVRGKMVPFSPEVINLFYQLPPDSLCFYANYHLSEEELDEIINYLTVGRGIWKITNERRVNFLTSKLNVPAKAWHYFISARLLPTNHLSEVTREITTLNYCIQEEKTINIGALIYNNIISSAASVTTAGLGFGSLIFSLCEQAGVKYDSWEEVLLPQKPIIKVNVKTYSEHSIFGWRGGFSRSYDVGPSGSTSAASSSRPSTSRASTSRDESSEILEELRKMRTHVNYTANKVHNLEHFAKHTNLYNRRKSDFEEKFYPALESMLKGDSGVSLPQFPPYPSFVPKEQWYSGDSESEE